MVESGRSHDLARTLSTVARDLQAKPDENETLAGIIHAAVATVPGVAHGGISQVQGRRVIPVVPTSELVAQCDKIQEQLDEGPCLDAIWQHHTVIVDDMAQEPRWPRFAARAAELGVGSMISFQLYVQEDNLGALNLYGATGARFGDDAQIIGEVFASHAAIALAGSRQHRQMSEALANRDAIGQAKGLLMQRENVSGLEAFDMLVRASQQSNIKVSDVAAWLIEEHERPGRANRPLSR